MFIAALFTIAKTWKRLEYLSTNKWIKKMWNTHTHTYTHTHHGMVLGHKKEIMPFAATQMDLEISH